MRYRSTGQHKSYVVQHTKRNPNSSQPHNQKSWQETNHWLLLSKSTEIETPHHSARSSELHTAADKKIASYSHLNCTIMFSLLTLAGRIMSETLSTIRHLGKSKYVAVSHLRCLTNFLEETVKVAQQRNRNAR